jgi:redox-sensitive bicupin YhaK (pirin superfamily)
VSNLEADPAELLVADRSSSDIEILQPREVPLGGPRAMTVRRTLPQKQRSLIGAWCFVDHYGPDDLRGRAGMNVPPHPHTGLQTVSWLFQGDIDHRDSLGSHAAVRPGELNLMTAGAGIAHSEVGFASNTVVHGAQLWVALPEGARHAARAFEHVVPEVGRLGAATVRVFIGELAGGASPAVVHTPLVGAQLDVPAGATVSIPVDASFEHGVLVDAGDITLDGVTVPRHHLAFAPAGSSTLTVDAATDARLLLIGGAPFGERIVMWWNFIGRSHDEIVEFRDQWQREVIAGENPSGRFGTVAGYDGPPLPAPELPKNVRLRPRE